MRVRRLFPLALFTILCFAAASSQEITLPNSEIDLGVGPSEIHRQMAQMKAGSLEKQFAAEKMLSPEVISAIDEYDVFYYDIHWRPGMDNMLLTGEVTMYARVAAQSINNVLLFLSDESNHDSVYNASGKLPSSHMGGLVTVYLDRTYYQDEEFNLTIPYSTPFNDYWETYSSEGLIYIEYQGITVLSNLSQPYDARDFWPCKDIIWDKFDSLDVHITVENEWTATSNGLLISNVDNGDGTHTSHWRHRYPLPTYSVCLAVSEYLLWTDYYVYSPTDSMPIENYVYPAQFDTTHASYGRMPEAIGIFSDMFTEYPFINEKYGNTQVIFGSMEHQTNTYMSSLYGDFQSLLNVLIHELAHSWWGNLITCRDWHNIWLNEGFASYCEALYYEVVEGEAYMHAYMENMEYRDGGTVYVYDISDPSVIFSWRSYDKGAWVLHMLRHVVGDEAFFNAMREYADTYAYGSAITDEFQIIMEAHAGMELGYFFQEWLHGTYYPNYRYGYLIEENPAGGWDTYLHIRQLQDTDPQAFTMPIDIHLNTTSGYETAVVFNNRRGQTFAIHTEDQVTSVEIDPDNWILSSQMWEEFGFHIITGDLAAPAQAEYYEDTVIAKGGSNTYACHLQSGQLPDGWFLDEFTGIISGYSTEGGEFTFTISATDLIYPQYYADTMTYTVTMGQPAERPGDANADNEVNVGDVVYVINYVFKQGPPPLFLNWADFNADCQVNVGDAVYLINHIFKEGPAPQPGCVE